MAYLTGLQFPNNNKQNDETLPPKSIASENIDIRLRSLGSPHFDFTLVHVPILQMTFDHLKRAVQERVEYLTPIKCKKGKTNEIPLDEIHIYWRKHRVRNREMVTDILGDEVEVLLRGGMMQFGVEIDGNVLVKKGPASSSGGVVIGSPMGDESSTDDDGASLCDSPAQRAAVEKEELPDKFWDNLRKFVKKQLGKNSDVKPEAVVDNFREFWNRGIRGH